MASFMINDDSIAFGTAYRKPTKVSLMVTIKCVGGT